MKDQPTTLGEKLKGVQQKPSWFLNTLLSVLSYVLFSFIVTLAGWMFLLRPDFEKMSFLVLWAVLIVLWVLVLIRRFGVRRLKVEPEEHKLLAHDRQGFMQDLRLDAKTVVIDGSNIYHFGKRNEVDAQALGLIADQLRVEGYRIVCFFDANIIHQLEDDGAFFGDAADHSITALGDVFGLAADEVYIVPTRRQADVFVLETLRHLPISFALSNDQFRDFGKHYGDVMQGDQWRKGVMIKGNELRVFKHRFQRPVRLV